MMLYNCPTCGQEVSHYAQTCPKCGEPEVGKLAKAHFASVTLPERERAATEQKALEERAKKQNRRGRIGAWIGALAGGIASGLSRLAPPPEYVRSPTEKSKHASTRGESPDGGFGPAYSKQSSVSLSATDS